MSLLSYHALRPQVFHPLLLSSLIIIMLLLPLDGDTEAASTPQPPEVLLVPMFKTGSALTTKPNYLLSAAQDPSVALLNDGHTRVADYFTAMEDRFKWFYAADPLSILSTDHSHNWIPLTICAYEGDATYAYVAFGSCAPMESILAVAGYASAFRTRQFPDGLSTCGYPNEQELHLWSDDYVAFRKMDWILGGCGPPLFVRALNTSFPESCRAAGGFFCSISASCVPDAIHKVCDGVADCANGEDEAAETCCARNSSIINDGTAGGGVVGGFWCSASQMCLYDERLLCDGVSDCSGGEDEAGCMYRQVAEGSVIPSTHPAAVSTDAAGFTLAGCVQRAKLQYSTLFAFDAASHVCRVYSSSDAITASYGGTSVFVTYAYDSGVVDADLATTVTFDASAGFTMYGSDFVSCTRLASCHGHGDPILGAIPCRCACDVGYFGFDCTVENIATMSTTSVAVVRVPRLVSVSSFFGRVIQTNSYCDPDIFWMSTENSAFDILVTAPAGKTFSASQQSAVKTGIGSISSIRLVTGALAARTRVPVIVSSFDGIDSTLRSRRLVIQSAPRRIPTSAASVDLRVVEIDTISANFTELVRAFVVTSSLHDPTSAFVVQEASCELPLIDEALRFFWATDVMTMIAFCKVNLTPFTAQDGIVLEYVWFNYTATVPDQMLASFPFAMSFTPTLSTTPIPPPLESVEPASAVDNYRLSYASLAISGAVLVTVGSVLSVAGLVVWVFFERALHDDDGHSDLAARSPQQQPSTTAAEAVTADESTRQTDQHHQQELRRFPSSTSLTFLPPFFHRFALRETQSQLFQRRSCAIAFAVLSFNLIVVGGLVLLVLNATSSGIDSNAEVMMEWFYDALTVNSTLSPIPFRLVTIPAESAMTCAPRETIGFASSVALFMAAYCEANGTSRSVSVKYKLGVSLESCNSKSWVTTSSKTILNSIANADVYDVARSAVLIQCATKASVELRRSQLAAFDALRQKTASTGYVLPLVLPSRLRQHWDESLPAAVQQPPFSYRRIRSSIGTILLSNGECRFESIAGTALINWDNSWKVEPVFQVPEETFTLPGISLATLPVTSALLEQPTYGWWETEMTISDRLTSIMNHSDLQPYFPTPRGQSRSDLPIGFLSPSMSQWTADASSTPRYYGVRGSFADVGRYFGPQSVNGAPSDTDGFTISMWARLPYATSTRGFLYAVTDNHQDTTIHAAPELAELAKLLQSGADGSSWASYGQLCCRNVYHALYVDGPAQILHFVLANSKTTQAGRAAEGVDDKTYFVHVAWDIAALGAQRLFSGSWHHIAVSMYAVEGLTKALLVVDGETVKSSRDWGRCMLRTPIPIEELAESLHPIPVQKSASETYATAGVLYIGYVITASSHSMGFSISQLDFSPTPIDLFDLWLSLTPAVRSYNAVDTSRNVILGALLLGAGAWFAGWMYLTSGKELLSQADADEEALRRITESVFRATMGTAEGGAAEAVQKAQKRLQLDTRGLLTLIQQLQHASRGSTAGAEDVSASTRLRRLLRDPTDAKTSVRPPLPSHHRSTADDVVDFEDDEGDNDLRGDGSTDHSAARPHRVPVDATDNAKEGGGCGIRSDALFFGSTQQIQSQSGDVSVAASLGATLKDILLPVLVPLQSVYVWFTTIGIPTIYRVSLGQLFTFVTLDWTAVFQAVSPLMTPLLQFFAMLVVMSLLYILLHRDEDAFLDYVSRYVMRRDAAAAEETKGRTMDSPQVQHPEGDCDEGQLSMPEQQRPKTALTLPAATDDPTNPPPCHRASEVGVADLLLWPESYGHGRLFGNVYPPPYERCAPLPLLTLSEAQAVDQLIGRSSILLEGQLAPTHATVRTPEGALCRVTKLPEEDVLSPEWKALWMSDSTIVKVCRVAAAEDDHAQSNRGNPLHGLLNVDDHSRRNAPLRQAPATERLTSPFGGPVLRDVGCRCAVHRSRRLHQVLYTDIAPFVNRRYCCTSTAGVVCGTSIGLMYVCDEAESVDMRDAVESRCEFALCEQHFRAEGLDAAVAAQLGGVRAALDSPPSALLMTLAFFLANALYTPFLKTAFMILACHPYFQCFFSECWGGSDVGFYIAAFLAIVAVLLLGVGFPVTLVALLLRRQQILREAFFSPQYGGKYGTDAKSLPLAEWRRFLSTDPTALGTQYASFELGWLFTAPLMCVWKVVLLLPCVFLESGSFSQSSAVAAVEFGYGVFLSVTEPAISPLVDAMYRLGAVHQMFFLGIQNLDIHMRYHGNASLSPALLALTGLYLSACLYSIVWSKVGPTIVALQRRKKLTALLASVGCQFAETTSVFRCPAL